MTNTHYTRCETADEVIAIAAANHVPHTHTAYAASVTLGGEVSSGELRDHISAVRDALWDELDPDS